MIFSFLTDSSLSAYSYNNVICILSLLYISGSFKIRGVVNQFDALPASLLSGEKPLVTMSAGNYGRSFSEACCKLGLKGKVLLPNTAPRSRLETIMVSYEKE